MISEQEKWIVYMAMLRYGGSFVHALGLALMSADQNNAQRIKDAFPEYWEQYRKMGGGK